MDPRLKSKSRRGGKRWFWEWEIGGEGERTIASQRAWGVFSVSSEVDAIIPWTRFNPANRYSQMLVLRASWFVNLTSGEYKWPKMHSKWRCNLWFHLKKKLFAQQSTTPSELEPKSSHIWNVSLGKMWCLSKKIVGAFFEMLLYWFSTRNPSASTFSNPFSFLI